MSVEILVAVVIAFGFFIQSVFGFASGLVTIPILSLVIGVKDSVTLVLIFQVLLGLIVVRTYRDINWSLALRVLLGAVLGVPAGSYFLSSLSPQYLLILLSVCIFLMIPVIGTKNTKIQKLTNQAAAPYIFGLIFGSIQSMFGVAGPISVIYLSVHAKNKEVFRATNLFVLFTTNIVRLFISFRNDLITEKLLSLAILAIPLFIASMFIGDKFSRKSISNETFYLCIKVILCLSASSMLFKAVT